MKKTLKRNQLSLKAGWLAGSADGANHAGHSTKGTDGEGEHFADSQSRPRAHVCGTSACTCTCCWGRASSPNTLHAARCRGARAETGPGPGQVASNIENLSFEGSELRTRSLRTHFDLKVMSAYRGTF